MCKDNSSSFAITVATVSGGKSEGLDFKSAGAVPNLPKSSDQFYFRIARTAPYWEHCERERGIFICMPPADMPKLAALKLSLFVVKLKG